MANRIFIIREEEGRCIDPGDEFRQEPAQYDTDFVVYEKKDGKLKRVASFADDEAAVAYVESLN